MRESEIDLWYQASEKPHLVLEAKNRRLPFGQWNIGRSRCHFGPGRTVGRLIYAPGKCAKPTTLTTECPMTIIEITSNSCTVRPPSAIFGDPLPGDRIRIDLGDIHLHLIGSR